MQTSKLLSTYNAMYDRFYVPSRIDPWDSKQLNLQSPSPFQRDEVKIHSSNTDNDETESVNSIMNSLFR